MRTDIASYLLKESLYDMVKNLENQKDIPAKFKDKKQYVKLCDFLMKKKMANFQ